MHWHWQNLNTHRDSLTPKGSGFWNGRAWFYLKALTFNLEWAFGRRAWHTKISISKNCGDGHNLTLHLALWRVFFIFFTIKNLPFVRYTDIYDIHKELSICLDRWILWVHFWDDPTGWGKRREFSYNFERKIFGRVEVEEKDYTDWQNFEIIMPEGSYPAKIRFYQRVRSWSRFRKARIANYAEIEMPQPIYFAGDGENDYDLDDDYFSSMDVRDLKTIEQAQKHVYNRVMGMRNENGLPANITSDPLAKSANEKALREFQTAE